VDIMWPHSGQLVSDMIHLVLEHAFDYCRILGHLSGRK
jgi:hypothetical protein